MTEPTQSATATGPGAHLAPWMNWRRKRFWLLAVFLAYALLGLYAVPPLLRWALESEFGRTGRDATVGEVRFNPFWLSLQVQNAEVRDEDGQALLDFGELFVNFQASSLFRWAWTFDEIRLAGLELHEERFAELDTRLTRLAEALAGPAEARTETGSTLPRVIIGHLALLNGKVAFTDRAAGDFEGAFGPINIEINDLRTLPDHSGAHAVSIRTANGGHIEWRGTLQTVPLASEGHLSVRGRGLEDAFRYADHFLPFTVSGESVTIDLDYHLGLRNGGLFLAIDGLQSEFRDGRLRAKGSDRDTLTVEAIRATDGSVRWPEQTARLESVAISGLDLKAGLLPDGSLDLTALIPESATDSGDAADEPFVIEVGALRIPAASLHLSDATPQPPVTLDLSPFDLELTGIDNRDGTSMALSLSTQLSTGGILSYRGQATALPELRSHGRLELRELALAVAQPYIEPHLRIELEDGTVELAADFEHTPEQAAKLSGRLQVSGVSVHDTRQDEKLLAWNTLDLDRFVLDASALSLETSVLEFDGLYGRLHIAEDLSTNVAGLMVEQETPPEVETGATASLQVAGIALENAALDFSDFSLPLPFRAAIRKLGGDISTLSTTSSEPARLSLEGQVNEYGLARIGGELNPWDPTALAHIDMTFRNLELARLTPYTIQFAGYAIDAGRLDLDLGYRLDERKLNGRNQVVIREIRLGDKVEHPGAGSLPLKLAVALLTDADGVIDLDVPVEGDLDDPQFRIGGVVWKAIGNLLTKVVSAPFRLLAGLVGANSEDFGTLQFAAGRADVSPPDREQLVKLGEAMLQRPELTLKVDGVYAAQADAEALAAQAVAALVEQRAEQLPLGSKELSIDHDRRVLESLASEQLPGIDLAAFQLEHTRAATEGAEPSLDLPAYLAALRDRLRAAQAIGEAELHALAAARAANVLAVLQESQPESGLKTTAIEIRRVEAEDPRSIPMELGVSAGQ